MGASARIILVLALLAFGRAWCGTGPETVAPPSAANGAPSKTAESPAKAAPVRANQDQDAEAATAANRADISAYREKAPLAFFSLGSLAVGGVFYGINESMRGSKAGYTSGNGKQLTTAVGLAGLTALIAAGSYVYFAKMPEESPRGWDASVSGGVGADGEPSIGALITLPLRSFLPLPSFSR
jgi:hypothetical protein